MYSYLLLLSTDRRIEPGAMVVYFLQSSRRVIATFTWEKTSSCRHATAAATPVPAPMQTASPPPAAGRGRRQKRQALASA
jgi:hypothetical protein